MTFNFMHPQYRNVYLSIEAKSNTIHRVNGCLMTNYSAIFRLSIRYILTFRYVFGGAICLFDRARIWVAMCCCGRLICTPTRHTSSTHKSIFWEMLLFHYPRLTSYSHLLLHNNNNIHLSRQIVDSIRCGSIAEIQFSVHITTNLSVNLVNGSRK